MYRTIIKYISARYICRTSIISKRIFILNKHLTVLVRKWAEISLVGMVNGMPRKPVEVNRECGLRLKFLLKERNVTQKDLAARLGYEPQHISNIVRGNRRLTGDFADRLTRDIFPDVRPEWLLCRDNFKTEAEKEAAAKRTWEEGQEATRLYNQAFHCFIDGIEDISGYGLQSQGADSLLGEYIVVTDKNGKAVGAVPAEAFDQMRDELEHYASYLVNLLVKNDMVSLPVSTKGGIENG